MQQLNSKDKLSQMSKKYKNLNVDMIISWSRRKNDLQGWRNKLVDVSSVLNPNVILDMGGGNGQQLLRFKSKYKKSFIAWIVDFANRPKEITKF